MRLRDQLGRMQDAWAVYVVAASTRPGGMRGWDSTGTQAQLRLLGDRKRQLCCTASYWLATQLQKP